MDNLKNGFSQELFIFLFFKNYGNKKTQGKFKMRA